MSKYYQRVVKDPEDYVEAVFDANEYFEGKYEEGQKILDVRGKHIETVALELPSYADYYYGMLQEINGIVRYLEIKEERMIGENRKNFLEHYARTLNANTAEKYAESQENVINLKILRNHVAITLNRFTGLLKAFDQLSYSISNIVRLRLGGFHDATF